MKTAHDLDVEIADIMIDVNNKEATLKIISSGRKKIAYLQELKKFFYSEISESSLIRQLAELEEKIARRIDVLNGIKNKGEKADLAEDLDIKNMVKQAKNLKCILR